MRCMQLNTDNYTDSINSRKLNIDHWVSPPCSNPDQIIVVQLSRKIYCDSITDKMKQKWGVTRHYDYTVTTPRHTCHQNWKSKPPCYWKIKHGEGSLSYPCWQVHCCTTKGRWDMEKWGKISAHSLCDPWRENSSFPRHPVVHCLMGVLFNPFYLF